MDSNVSLLSEKQPVSYFATIAFIEHKHKMYYRQNGIAANEEEPDLSHQDINFSDSLKAKCQPPLFD